MGATASVKQGLVDKAHPLGVGGMGQRMNDAELNARVAKLQPDFMAEFRDAFGVIDKDKAGVVKAEDIGPLMRQMGFDMDKTELDRLLQGAGIKDGSTFSEDEFLAMMERKLAEGPSAKELQEAFETFDANGSGNLNGEELQAALKCLEDPPDVEALMKVADTNKDGCIDYKEFIAFITTTRETVLKEGPDLPVAEGSESKGSDAAPAAAAAAPSGGSPKDFDAQVKALDSAAQKQPKITQVAPAPTEETERPFSPVT